MSKLEQVLSLDPQTELRFKGPFSEVVTSYLKLINPSDKRVCFKVKTTAPKRYCVRPNSGIVESKETISVAVMLQPFLYDPNEKNKHKFMVQTMFAPDGDVNLETLWKDVNPDNLMDSKLKCVFELPNEITSQNNLDVSGITSEDRSNKVIEMPKSSPKASNLEFELRKVVEENKQLREECNHLRIENVQLKEEGIRLRRITPISGSADKGGLSAMSAEALATMAAENQQQSQSPSMYVLICIVAGFIGLILGKILL